LANDVDKRIESAVGMSLRVKQFSQTAIVVFRLLAPDFSLALSGSYHQLQDPFTPIQPKFNCFI